MMASISTSCSNTLLMISDFWLLYDKGKTVKRIKVVFIVIYILFTYYLHIIYMCFFWLNRNRSFSGEGSGCSTEPAKRPPNASPRTSSRQTWQNVEHWTCFSIDNVFTLQLTMHHNTFQYIHRQFPQFPFFPFRWRSDFFIFLLFWYPTNPKRLDVYRQLIDL